MQSRREPIHALSLLAFSVSTVLAAGAYLVTDARLRADEAGDDRLVPLLVLVLAGAVGVSLTIVLERSLRERDRAVDVATVLERRDRDREQAVAARLLVEEELRSSERELRLVRDRWLDLIENANDVIFTLDGDGRIATLNRAGERSFGRDRTAVLGRSLLEFVASADADALADVVGACVGGRIETCTLEAAIVAPDGRTTPLEMSLRAIARGGDGGVEAIARDVAERRALERELVRQAFHDELTGLANRALFVDRVEQAILQRAEGRATAVLLIDLDDFKTVNDSLGHLAGDSLLQAVATRLRACLRPGDTCARLGGDEFTILLEDLADVAGAAIVAGRVLDALAAPIDVDGADLTVRASVGIAVVEAGVADARDLLRRADIAMYAAKGALAGGVAVFEPRMLETIRERVELTGDLRLAIEEGALAIEYQPIVELSSGHVFAVEALVRWPHPTRGPLSPAAFLPLAEETGLITPLGAWVLEAACRTAASWSAIVPDAPLLCVNVSGRQLDDGGFVDVVRAAVERSGLAPERLVLEVTESVLLGGGASGLLAEVRALGVKLAIDDFGTGYRSTSSRSTASSPGRRRAARRPVSSARSCRWRRASAW